MKDYTKDEYIKKFGAEMYAEKVERGLDMTDGGAVEKIYATDNGNIFMIMRAPQKI